jgi:hypothetical protein
MEKWRHEDTETWTWRQNQTENGSPSDLPLSVYRLLVVQMEVFCLSVYRKKQTEVIHVQTDLTDLPSYAIDGHVG